MKAFTINVNNPKVKTFKGSVRIIRIGLTSKLKNARIIADSKADHNESIVIQLLINVDKSKSETQLAIIDKKKFLISPHSPFQRCLFR